MPFLVRDAPDRADDAGMFRDAESLTNLAPVAHRRRHRHAVRNIRHLLRSNSLILQGKRNRAPRVENDGIGPPRRQAVKQQLPSAFIDIFRSDGRENDRNSGEFRGDAPKLIAVEQQREDNIRPPRPPRRNHAPDTAQQNDVEPADDNQFDSGGAKRVTMRRMRVIFQAIDFLFDAAPRQSLRQADQKFLRAVQRKLVNYVGDPERAGVIARHHGRARGLVCRTANRGSGRAGTSRIRRNRRDKTWR